MSWVIREYEPKDLDCCLRLMRSNIPTFFADHELKEFSDDLVARQVLASHRRWPYFVLVTNDIVRACGGYEINKQQEATLIWGMVHRSEHRQGLGSYLLNYRIAHMKGKAEYVLLDTTPESFKFYKKSGFIQTKIKKDGYAFGMDTVYAKLKL